MDKTKAQAVPDIQVRLDRYVTRGKWSTSVHISQEWVGLLKQRIIRAHDTYVRNLWDQTHGS